MKELNTNTHLIPSSGTVTPYAGSHPSPSLRTVFIKKERIFFEY